MNPLIIHIRVYTYRASTLDQRTRLNEQLQAEAVRSRSRLQAQELELFKIQQMKLALERQLQAARDRDRDRGKEESPGVGGAVAREREVVVRSDSSRGEMDSEAESLAGTGTGAVSRDHSYNPGREKAPAQQQGEEEEYEEDFDIVPPQVQQLQLQQQLSLSQSDHKLGGAGGGARSSQLLIQSVESPECVVDKTVTKSALLPSVIPSRGTATASTTAVSAGGTVAGAVGIANKIAVSPLTVIAPAQPATSENGSGRDASGVPGPSPIHSSSTPGEGLIPAPAIGTLVKPTGNPANLSFTKEDVGQQILLFSFKLNSWETVSVLDYDANKQLHKVLNERNKDFADNNKWIDLRKKPVKHMCA